MRVALLVPVLSTHDAVGNDVLEMAVALRACGHEVRLYADSAIHIDEAVHKPSTLRQFLRDRNDVLLYHYSIGWPAAHDLLQNTRARCVVRYHNVTPARFFEPYSRDYVNACSAGRAQIADIVALDRDLYLADSPYNLDELLDLGLAPERGAVLPPFNRVDELIAANADLDFIDRHTDGTHLLMVGRIAPNKGHVALIDAFAVYRREFDPDARLLIVGKEDPRLAGYGKLIRERARRWGVADHVSMLGAVSEGQLKAAYLSADAFVLLSEHEGFCVPVVEAMALGVPIVANGATAVASTVGDAGIVWDSNDPLLFATALAHLQTDAALRAQLREAGQRRFRENYSTRVLAARLVELLERMPLERAA